MGVAKSSEESKIGIGKYLLLFVVMILGTFLDGLDGTIVNVVLPEIADTFGVGTSEASWVITIYFLIMAGLILIIGKVCDRGAIKKVLIAGFITFSLGSLLCGVSHTFEALLVFRAVQGVGAAMLASSCVMMTVKFLPGYMIAFGLSVSVLGYYLGASLGPVLGGIIGEYMSWHWIFFINVPIGIFAAILTKRVIPADGERDRTRFDVVGSVILFMMLLFGLYSLESVTKTGLAGFTLVSFVMFLVLLPAFILYELRSDHPVLNLRMFRSGRLNMLILAYLLINACYMGGMYLLPFYLDIGLGMDSISRGMYLLIPAVVTLLICLYVGKVCIRLGKRPFVIAACLAMIAFSLVFTIVDGSSPMSLVLFGLVMFGLIWGLCGGPAGDRLIESVPDGDKASGSAVLSFLIYFGCALGTALFSGLFNIGSPLPGTSISNLPQYAFMEGMHFAMLIGTVLSIVALVLTILVKDRSPENGSE